MSFLNSNHSFSLRDHLSCSTTLAVLQCALVAPVLYQVYANIQDSDEEDKSFGSRSAAPATNITTLTTYRVSKKVSNLIVYGPSAALAYYQSTLKDNVSNVPKLLLAHFGKKAVELFVMDGMRKQSATRNSNDTVSSTVPAVVTATTSTFYSVGTYLMLHQRLPVPAGMDASQIIFWMGQLGHALHAQLLEENESSSSRSAVVPESGLLFRYIAAPHLLFEMMTWVGLAKAGRNQSTTVQCGLVVAVLAYQAKKVNDQINGSSSEDGLPSSLVNATARSGVDGELIKTQKKRWTLIPYIY